MKLKKIIIIGLIQIFSSNMHAQHPYSYIKTAKYHSTSVKMGDSLTLKELRYYFEHPDLNMLDMLNFCKEVVLDNKSEVESYFLSFQYTDSGNSEQIWIKWNPNASKYETLLDIGHYRFDSVSNLEYEIVIQMDSSMNWQEYSYTIENNNTDSIFSPIEISEFHVDAYLDWIKKDITQLDSLFIPTFHMVAEVDIIELQTDFKLNSLEIKSLLKSKVSGRTKPPSQIRKNCRRISCDKVAQIEVWKETGEYPWVHIEHEVHY